MWLNCTRDPIQLIRRHLSKTKTNSKPKLLLLNAAKEAGSFGFYDSVSLSAFGGYFCACFLLFRSFMIAHTHTYTYRFCTLWENLQDCVSSAAVAASAGVAANLVKAAAAAAAVAVRIDTLLRLASFFFLVIVVVGVFSLCVFVAALLFVHLKVRLAVKSVNF